MPSFFNITNFQLFHIINDDNVEHFVTNNSDHNTHTHTVTDVTSANTNSTLIVGNTGSGNGVYNAIKFAGNQQDMYMMSFNNSTQANRRLGFFVGSVAGDAVSDERFSILGNGSVQARRARSNTAGEVALSLQPTDSTIHYGFRIDQATNSFNLDRVDSAGQLLRVEASGNATFSGDLSLTSGKILFGTSYNGTIGTASGDLFIGTADSNILFYKTIP